MDLIGYLSNGYPSPEETIKNAAAYIEGGVDVIEIDLPSNNPYIDGEVLQHRMKESYKNDPSLQSQAETMRKIHRLYPTQRLFALAYEETILKFGVEEYISLMLDCQVEAVILVATSNQDVKNKLKEEGIKVASYVPYDLPKGELEEAKLANGFVYLQAKPATDVKTSFDSLKEVITHLRQDVQIKRPINCGVGISTRQDVEMVRSAGANGVFIGSSLLKKSENKSELIEFLKDLKEGIR